MRPVNLIPPEERRGERSQLRTGALAYVIVAGLAIAVAGVSALVVTGNSINERKAEVAQLEAREAAVRAEAESLRAYADFASVSESRAQTVTSLARSRFDWERVLQELALVVPEDIWLTELSGTATPAVQLDNAAEVTLQSQVSGPSLAMVGCGTGHEAVARFLQALKDIDGVTRVGIASSGKAEDTGGTTTDGGAAGGSSDCRTRDFIVRFEVVAAFDAVAVPPVDAAAPPATPAPQTEAGETGEAQQAANIVPGVAK